MLQKEGIIGRFFETTLTAGRIEAHASAGEWLNQNLSDQIAHWVEQRPDDVVLVDRFGQVTWSEFGADVDAVSYGLLELGVRPGEVVQVQLPNWHQFVVAVVALEQISAVINPVAPIFRHKEVTVMSDLARPTVVITAAEFRGFELAAMHAELRESCDWVNELVVVPSSMDDEAAPADAMTWSELLEQGRFSSYDKATLDLLRPSPNGVCEVIFTSGTTGIPKGVMHSPNTLNAAADLMVDVVGAEVASPWGDQAPDALVMHMASTLAHQTGFVYGGRLPLLTGGRLVLQDVWDPIEFMRLADEHDVNMSMGATPFLADVVNSPEIENYSLKSWKIFICGGAAIPKPLLKQADKMLPECTVATVWGMTECSALTVGRPGDPFEKRLTDGLALQANEVRVVNDAGVSVVDEIGDLQCRGSLLFLGYVQGREITNEHLTADNTITGNGTDEQAALPWFHTGDRALIDPQGYITISGRSKDIIIRGGENIPVKEVEDVLIQHPAVTNVAIVGKPDDRLGEVGCAFIIAADTEPTLSELLDWLRENQVTQQFWPEDLVVVNEFPMTPSGKVQKYRLREQLG